MVALLAMAALAIDVVSLYSARSEAQRTAEAAALAGAQVFANSGFTSGNATWGAPSSPIAQTAMCNSGNGLAEKAAQATLARNPVANSSATANVVCDFTNPTVPRITITVQRTGLPTFFARIWGGAVSSVTTTAVAEAFNPSGQTATPVQVTSVMPWLIPNCDPYNNNPPNPNPTNFCNTNGGGSQQAYFIDPATSYAVANPTGSLTPTGGAPPTAIIGQELRLVELQPGAGNTPKALGLSQPYIGYFAADVPITATSASCPSTAAISGSCTTVNSTNPGYYETIACENSQPLACGQTLNIDPLTGSGTLPSQQATLCRIHASQKGCNHGQDLFNNAPGGGCSGTSECGTLKTR